MEILIAERKHPSKPYVLNGKKFHSFDQLILTLESGQVLNIRDYKSTVKITRLPKRKFIVDRTYLIDSKVHNESNFYTP